MSELAKMCQRLDAIAGDITQMASELASISSALNSVASRAARMSSESNESRATSQHVAQALASAARACGTAAQNLAHAGRTGRAYVRAEYSGTGASPAAGSLGTDTGAAAAVAAGVAGTASASAAQGPGGGGRSVRASRKLGDRRGDLVAHASSEDERDHANNVGADRFVSPERIVQTINDGGSDVRGRGHNCVDCALSFVATWYGTPTVAAEIWEGAPIPGDRDRNAVGETDGYARMEQVLGGRFQRLGSSLAMGDADPGRRSGEQLGDLAVRLQELGPGACALVICRWQQLTTGEDRGGHAFNMVNDAGRILLVDPQNEEVAAGPHGYAMETMRNVEAIVVDRQGRAVAL